MEWLCAILSHPLQPYELYTADCGYIKVPEFAAAGGGEGFVFDEPIASYIPEYLEDVLLP